jgi:hypothetical protein
MVGAYFAEMVAIFRSLFFQLRPRGRAYIVLGDSRYAKVTIPTAAILAEFAQQIGFTVLAADSFRSMRLAPQQGGRRELAETLLILRKP